MVALPITATSRLQDTYNTLRAEFHLNFPGILIEEWVSAGPTNFWVRFRSPSLWSEVIYPWKLSQRVSYSKVINVIGFHRQNKTKKKKKRWQSAVRAFFLVSSIHMGTKTERNTRSLPMQMSQLPFWNKIDQLAVEEPIDRLPNLCSNNQAIKTSPNVVSRLELRCVRSQGRWVQFPYAIAEMEFVEDRNVKFFSWPYPAFRDQVHVTFGDNRSLKWTAEAHLSKGQQLSYRCNEFRFVPHPTGPPHRLLHHQWIRSCRSTDQGDSWSDRIADRGQFASGNDLCTIHADTS